ncbi:YSC84-related protein [Dinoroseobacter sp. S76]|uniref:lipid-binding SYLF domain-containing protein n=1 Tax=Dinoroseobacter sp. S76 TaxID=3415124 RepID=UPI003C7A7572
MTQKITRRGAVLGASLGALVALAGCASVEGSAQRAATIDQRVDAALLFLESSVPGASDLGQKASGVLVMPLITEAGFGVGGAYGKGALRINGATIDYYQGTQASFGFQIGAQQYAHAIFFMTDEALQNFRNGSGVTVGGDLEITLADTGESISAETLTARDPVVGIIFGQAGLIAGASLNGTVYNRIIP